MGLMMSMHVAKFGGRNNNRNGRVMNHTVIVTFVDIVVIFAAFTNRRGQRLHQSNGDIATTASVLIIASCTHAPVG